MFGAGYAGAADRLFLMDVLRHTGRAELASFLGGSNAAADAEPVGLRALHRSRPAKSRSTQAPQIYGAGRPAGGRRRQTPTSKGSTPTSPPPTLDPTLKPGEYTLLNKPMEPWKPTDVIAIASLIGGIFGRGGGNELNSALTMQAFVERMGRKAGRKAWLGFRSKNDPEAPTTISKPLPVRDRAAPSPSGAWRCRTRARCVEPPIATAPSAAAGAGGLGSVGGRLLAALEAAGHASNWELVSAKHSATGHPIAVMGPQVGYYVPQILMEEDLHGPGIDARGAAFAGVNLYVAARPRPRLRLERDHGDLRQRRHLRRGPLQGQLPLPLPRQVPGDGKAGQDRELDAERDRPDRRRLADPDRLPDRARDRLRPRQGRTGKKVAFVAPAQHLLPRGRLGDRLRAAERTGRRHRRRRASRRPSRTSTSSSTGPTSTPNTSPTRCPGRCRSGRRAPRPTSRSSAPASTTGRASSRRPRRPTTCRSPSTRRRSTRDFLVSWNNKQAPEWAAADDKYGYGPLLPLADDRRQGRDRHQGRAEDDDRPAGPGDGGTGDPGPARRTGCCR